MIKGVLGIATLRSYKILLPIVIGVKTIGYVTSKKEPIVMP
jgi:hypothetical protein